MSIHTIFKQTFPDVKIIVDPLMQMKVNVREAEKEISFEKSGDGDYSYVKAMDILYELSINISDEIDIEINRFLFSERRIVMTGTTDNFNSVDRIKTNLDKSSLFKNITISSATAENNGTRVKFNFAIDL
ncbi:PilN domain-containing protein [Desulfamplus magnetovallimortis]|nr:PilN domain-containing protein [Desulfamplus magnetovallimortis]